MEFFEDLVQTMDEPAAWEFLGRHKLGRLGFHMVEKVEVLPINYRVHGRNIYFRTAEGSKLLGILLDHDVAFEVDEWVGDQAASVVVHGNCRELSEQIADDLRETIQPWIAVPKSHVMVIEPTSISGRHFKLESDHTGDS
ncbi:MAG TPA: pyridoxamine 5'-phosphate oxidase family protein [Marmoricola sp.]|nr:pyridoxamine 5'-phosphate oxidase family protein [Marmoricola sp.]HNJ79014.1 pyridoxamine 5'-phosphate oxidase family protein [Marmoricola sp.]HNO39992.1 pyridoxamine 5'-phosphate oxidase family protein [Marmoricola sp.]